MLESHRIQAIDVAKSFLSNQYPRVVGESEINAEHIAGDDRLRRRAELPAQLKALGLEDDHEEIEQLGLDHDHWLVRFFHRDEPGAASTLPPTIVRVYDADGRTEVLTS